MNLWSALGSGNVEARGACDMSDRRSKSPVGVLIDLVQGPRDLSPGRQKVRSTTGIRLGARRSYRSNSFLQFIQHQFNPSVILLLS